MRVYGGHLEEAADGRLVYERRRGAPVWVVGAVAYLCYAAIFAIWHAAWELGAVAMGIAIAGYVSAFQQISLRALDWSQMPRVARRLSIERCAPMGFREPPRYAVAVDGVSLPPTTRRALFHFDYKDMAAYVLVVDRRCFSLNVRTWSAIYNPDMKYEEAREAILTGDGARIEPETPCSMAPLVRGLIRTLELGPDRLGGSLATFSTLNVSESVIQRLVCDVGCEAWYYSIYSVILVMLVVAWQFHSSFWVPPRLSGHSVWVLAFVGATVCFVPAALVMIVVARWMFIGPFNARAAEMIERTPE